MTNVADNTVLTDKTSAQSVVTAIINAPIERIDIVGWLRNLPDKEYQRCAPPDHKAVGYTTTDDGRPMSINVEMIGTSLMVQHYVYEIAERLHCRMVSLSDVLTPRGWTTVQVIWDLNITDNGDGTCTYTNSVTGHPTADFVALAERSGTRFDVIAPATQAAAHAHNQLETPRYAASIECWSLAHGKAAPGGGRRAGAKNHDHSLESSE
jgi:hypothetical protein